jgi:Ribulose-phosphate 3 epimerase family
VSRAEIVASVLGADYSVLGAEVAELERAGVDRIQWDIMDGRFVPNLTFGADVVAACHARASVPFEAHLMVEDPDPWLGPFAEAGRPQPGDPAGVRPPRARPGGRAAGHDRRPGRGGQAYLQAMEAKITEAHQLVAQSTGQASTGSAHDSHELDLSADCQQRSHTSPRVAPPRLVPHPG